MIDSELTFEVPLNDNNNISSDGQLPISKPWIVPGSDELLILSLLSITMVESRLEFVTALSGSSR